MTDTLHAEPEVTLYITDAEVIRRMGVPEKVARVALHELDRDPRRTGFPQKDRLFGNRRYWPAVRAWLDRHNRIKLEPSKPRRDHE